MILASLIPCVFVLISLSVLNVDCAKLPSGIRPCKITDSSCLKDSAQKFVPLLAAGLPEFGIPSIAPMLIGEVRNNDGVLNFNFTDGKIFGLETSIINELSFDTKKKRISLVFINTGYLEANYKANGRLLILPVVGDGKSFFKTYDIQYIFKISYDIVKGKDGKEHMKILKHKVTYSPKSVEFRFTNLFNGNKQLGDAIHTFGNQNWKELFPELGKPFMLKITNSMIDMMGKLFAKIPMEDLFLS